MKTLSFSFILTCMMCMTYISCDESKVQDDILSESEIEYREIDDCSECPIDYCCCTIELYEDSPSAMLKLCGVYTNETVTTPCGFSAPGSCPSVSGTLSILNLIQGTDPRKYFCLPFGGSFRIYNDNASDNVRLKMTCHPEITDPVYQIFNLDATDAIFFEGDSNCDLTGC